MKPIPQTVRDEIIAACDRGEPREATAKKYGVSTAFVRRLLQRRRECGSYAIKPRKGGRKPSIAGKRLVALKRLVRERPAATVRGLADAVGASTAAVCRTLQKLGHTVKQGRYTETKHERFRSPATEPVFETRLGRLHEADCMTILPRLAAERAGMVFCDPPFNLNKKYGRRGHDRRTEDEYLRWCRRWLAECVRVLKPGGTIFIWHVPKWAMRLGTDMLDLGLTFQNWIAVDFNLGSPIPNRLSPRHYALLYLTKGTPGAFNTIRVPIATCRHCGGDVRDYGGHRNDVHADGVRLTDHWCDITPVRHKKHRRREANHLPPKLVERCVRLSTRPGDLVVDPFAGAGTVAEACERLGRRWVAVEIEPVDGIVPHLRQANQSAGKRVPT